MQANHITQEASPAADLDNKMKEITAGFVDTSLDLENNDSWFRSRFKSCPTSMTLLREAEKNILSYVKTPIKGEYVNISPVVGKKELKIWTLSLTGNNPEKTPVVLLHGLGSGVALWSLNLDGLAAKRPVYAFDMLGFGRSSRPSFSCNAHEAEMELVESIEEWRKEMKLERFALLGHSMGGFVVTSYAMKYPNRVSHLILADPWGFSEKPDDASGKYNLPFWVKTLAYVSQPLNPLWPIRMFGFFMGPRVIEKYRSDLVQKFSPLSQDGDAKIADYIYHCNAQTPSGESAFRSLMSSFGWAKNPMIKRLSTLDKDLPTTFIYGGSSYIDHCPEEVIRENRPNSYVDVKVMPGCGHHVNADNWKLFNEIVLNAAANGDQNDLTRFPGNSNEKNGN